MTDILRTLHGGDRRSIGHADKVAQEVGTKPDLFEEFFSGLYADEPIIRMMASDAIEKVTQTRPELLTGYVSKVIAILATAQQQEVCWHMAQIAPRLQYSAEEEKEIVASLKEYLSHKSKIVQVSAMEALAIFAERNTSMLAEVINILDAHQKTGSPAVRSRGKKLLIRLRRR